MIDIVDEATRSRMMASVRGRDTKPERALRSALHRQALRFRVHRKDLPGRPDIVLPRHRVVVFVNGCFWHRHEGCRYSTTPATRSEFWQAKFKANVRRDQRNQELLLGQGWRVAVVWECDIKAAGADAVAERLGRWILNVPDSIFESAGLPTVR